MKSKYVKAVAAPKSDSTTYSSYDAVYIGGAGNCTFDFLSGGTNIEFVGMVAGTVYPFEVTKVYSTGTTATNIVLLDSLTTY
jgi:hypothetical protein